MSIRGKQVVAAVLALSAAFVGGWAQFAPEAFYEYFPLPGHHWVSGLGPYNEHLVRDVGGLYLALLMISGWTVVRPREETFRASGLGWTVFSIGHLVFHLGHLGMFPVLDQVGSAVTLGGTLLLGAALLVPVRASVAVPAEIHPSRTGARSKSD